MFITDKIRFYFEGNNFNMSRNPASSTSIETFSKTSVVGNPLIREDPYFIVTPMQLNKKMLVGRMYYNGWSIAEWENKDELSPDKFCEYLFRRYEEMRDTAIITNEGQVVWIEEKGLSMLWREMEKLKQQNEIPVVFNIEDSKCVICADGRKLCEINLSNEVVVKKNFPSVAYQKIINAYIRSDLQDNEIIYASCIENDKREIFAVSLDNGTTMRSLCVVPDSFIRALRRGQEGFLFDGMDNDDFSRMARIGGHVFPLRPIEPYAKPDEGFIYDVMDLATRADEMHVPIAGLNKTDEEIFLSLSPYLRKEYVIRQPEQMKEIEKA